MGKIYGKHRFYGHLNIENQKFKNQSMFYGQKRR